jgi:hypothetical protein
MSRPFRGPALHVGGGTVLSLLYPSLVSILLSCAGQVTLIEGHIETHAHGCVAPGLSLELRRTAMVLTMPIWTHAYKPQI